jgi:hypothetical protein
MSSRTASSRGTKQCPDSSDVTILENQIIALSCSSDRTVDHRSGQIVSANNLIWKQQPKHRIDSSQQAIAEIRFFPRFNRGDPGRSKDRDQSKPRRKQGILGLSLEARKEYGTSLCLVSATITQKGGCRAGTAGMKDPRELRRVVYRNFAKFGIGLRPRMRTKAIRRD